VVEFQSSKELDALEKKLDWANNEFVLTTGAESSTKDVQVITGIYKKLFGENCVN
jgi:hypothetical protein